MGVLLRSGDSYEWFTVCKRGTYQRPSGLQTLQCKAKGSVLVRAVRVVVAVPRIDAVGGFSAKCSHVLSEPYR